MAQAGNGLGFFIAMDGMYAASAGRARAAIAMDGMYAASAGRARAAIAMDGMVDFCSMQNLHFPHPWWSYATFAGMTSLGNTPFSG